MNVPAHPLRAGFQRLLPLFLVLLVAGCATRDEVQNAVNAANVAALSSDLNPGAAGAIGSANVAEASRRIEAFIAANPEQKAANASLRVRQAVMLLQNGQTNLARAAFNAASLDDLKGSTRDQALKHLQETLIWYGQMAGNPGAIMDAGAEQHYQAVTKQIEGLKAPADEEIHDYLAAVRAWIGIKQAAAAAESAGKKLTDTINDYARTLPSGETARWEAAENLTGAEQWPAGMTFETAITAASRRHFRALDLIEGAKAAMRSNAITVPPDAINDPYFRTRLK